MLVIVPFTDLRPETKEALDASGCDWEAHFVGESDTAYWELLNQLWIGGFTLNEHDIVPNLDTFKSFEDCPELWCAAPYPYFVGDYAGLGCTRFRTELIHKTPNLMEEVATMSNAKHPPRHWCSLDAFMQSRLFHYGFTRHLHEPVCHLNGGEPAHGCR